MKPGTSGWKASWYLGWPVAATAPMVRPWKDFSAVMISKAPPLCCLPHLWAILIAASLASAPLLQKKTRLGKDSSTSRLASATCGSE